MSGYEMYGKIENHDSKVEKVERVLGINQPSALDLVDRSKFASDEAYLDAVVAEQMKMDNPAYKAARRKLELEYLARSEKAERKAQHEEFAKIKSEVKLASYEVDEINAKAVDMAKRDLSAGRIGASQLSDKILDYAETLKEKKVGEKAGNAMINKMIRGF